MDLYNVCDDPESKLAVLLEALGYAQRAGQADLLLPVIRVGGSAGRAGGWVGVCMYVPVCLGRFYRSGRAGGRVF